MVSELLNKYIWLVSELTRAGRTGLPLGQIQSRWESRWGGELKRRTLINHRQAIAEVFGITIECDRSTNNYYIVSLDDVTDLDSNTAWLVNTFTVNNLLSLGKERLKGRVAVEDIPSGRMWLTSIMQAMEENRVIEITYRKYDSLLPEKVTVSPYAVKESDKRWYLIGHAQERGALRVYALDRIRELVPVDKTFSMPRGFDVDELFSASFGMFLSDGNKPVEVVFRATEKEAAYLRDLPLHPSQKELKNGGNETFPVVFSIFVMPNVSLVYEFCKRTSRLEVISPETVRGMVAEELMNAGKIYK